MGDWFQVFCSEIDEGVWVALRDLCLRESSLRMLSGATVLQGLGCVPVDDERCIVTTLERIHGVSWVCWTQDKRLLKHMKNSLEAHGEEWLKGRGEAFESRLEKVRLAIDSAQVPMFDIEELEKHLGKGWVGRPRHGRFIVTSEELLDRIAGRQTDIPFTALEIDLFDGYLQVFVNGAEARATQMPQRLTEISKLEEVLQIFQRVRPCMGNAGKHEHYAQKHLSLAVSFPDDKRRKFLELCNPFRTVVGGIFDSGSEGNKLVRVIEQNANGQLIIRSMDCAVAAPGLKQVCESCKRMSMLLNKKDKPSQPNAKTPNATASRQELLAKVEEQARTIRNHASRFKRLNAKYQELCKETGVSARVRRSSDLFHGRQHDGDAAEVFSQDLLLHSQGDHHVILPQADGILNTSGGDLGKRPTVSRDDSPAVVQQDHHSHESQHSDTSKRRKM